MSGRTFERILVTGGAGFIGSSLAVALADALPGADVTALDSLKRRGSELTLDRLREHGVAFVHGDIRCEEDLVFDDPFDLVIECSAEPSVLQGYGGGNPRYMVRTNLVGTAHCLELARRHEAAFLFLSTSRVYPIEPLRGLQLREEETRFELADDQPLPGVTARGVAEDFPLAGHRSLYGATKLASELLVEEYRHAFGVPTVVNRCGVVTGPWQMGKVDQGVFSLWLLAHHFGRPLSYIGYGGSGRQVRDLLHVDDLVRIVGLQLADFDALSGSVFNVGGGRESSLSLVEATRLCREITGREVPIDGIEEAREGDVPLYLSDTRRLREAVAWDGPVSPEETLRDSYAWIVEHEAALRRVQGG